MAKAVITTTRYQQNFRFEQKNVIRIFIANYGTNDMTVIYNDYRRGIPPAVRTGGVDVPQNPFVLDLCGVPFDCKLSVEFDGGAGDCLVDYGAVEAENC